MSLRRIDSTLEGHPTPNNPWIKVASGSLGQGLAAANGMAAANRLDGIDARIYCLMGDGGCSEGSVWEAAQFASLNRLTNLIAIVDVNGLGQSEATPYHHDTGVFARRFAAFGWRTLEIDGHDMAAIIDALHQGAKDLLWDFEEYVGRVPHPVQRSGKSGHAYQRRISTGATQGATLVRAKSRALSNGLLG